MREPSEDMRGDAAAAGLRYATDREPGLSRRRRGRGWSFHWPDGETVRDPAIKERCRTLAVPPAYEDVWICRDARGHLQATGRDAKGRKTYLYHPAWRAFRDARKFAALPSFGHALGAARRANETLRQRGAPDPERVVAAVFRLLDTHALRIGHEAYAEENGSYGATTLRPRHLSEDAATLRFTGKGGRERRIPLADPRLRRFLGRLADLPGQPLFQVRSEGGLRPITSSEVNDHLRRLFGQDVTAKTFRTWHGSVAAFAAGLAPDAKVDDVLGAAAARLGNTKAVCRQSYVHPRIVQEVKAGSLFTSWVRLKGGRARKGLTAEETWFLRWLEQFSSD